MKIPFLNRDKRPKKQKPVVPSLDEERIKREQAYARKLDNARKRLNKFPERSAYGKKYK
jgi:hypothetical protein